jgi:Arc/MetJ family transcription regulator
MNLDSRAVDHNQPISTNLRIDDELLNEALLLSGLGTKGEAVTLALQEFVIKRRQLAALELAGSIDFDPEYDYKEQRKLR